MFLKTLLWRNPVVYEYNVWKIFCLKWFKKRVIVKLSIKMCIKMKLTTVYGLCVAL